MASDNIEKDLAWILRIFGKRGISHLLHLGTETSASLLTLAERDAASAALVHDYMTAAARTYDHADVLARQALQHADERLRPLIKQLPPDMRQLLSAQLDHRRLLILATEQELEQQMATSAGRAIRTELKDGTSALAASTHRRFIEQTRALLRASAVRPVSVEEADLLAGHRRLQTVLGDDWLESWSSVYTYLCRNADSILAHAEELKAATAGLDAARDAGAYAVRSAARRLTSARRRLGGHRSNIQGRVLEGYIPKWDRWIAEVNRVTQLAEEELQRLPDGWSSRRVTGGIWLDDAEVWDEAILLLRDATSGNKPLARLYMAAQYKAEKVLSAPDQVMRDILREVGGSTPGRAPVLRIRLDGRPVAYNLIPNPTGAPSLRYLANAAGGTVPSPELQQLASHGVALKQLTVDLRLNELDRIVDNLILALPSG
jgi:hypothetical protein